MKRRMAIQLGRTGTVLMVIGLALFMLSLIPPRTVENTDFRQTLNLQPRTFTFDLSFFLTIPADPQHGFYLDMQANNSVTAYLLSISREYIQQWITTHFNDVQPSPTPSVSVLEEFLKDHSALVTWRGNLADTPTELQYAPTRIMNVSLVFSNPNVEVAKVKYSGKLLNFIVPSERALNPVKILIPAGFVLTIPWLNATWKTSKKHIPKLS